MRTFVLLFQTRQSRLTRVELVMLTCYQASVVRPVLARRPLIRCGRYWIFFSCA
jgi:hypothetical protein